MIKKHISYLLIFTMMLTGILSVAQDVAITEGTISATMYGGGMNRNHNMGGGQRGMSNLPGQSSQPGGQQMQMPQSSSEPPLSLPSDMDSISGMTDISDQWYLDVTNSDLVWDYIASEQDETVYVAVLDTGVDYEHVDLENRVDESLGYDFVNNDSDPMDDNGHGTHVAGIIAAEADNDEGIDGVTGNLDIVIIPIKVLDENGTGEIENLIQGIEYAIDQGADIINISSGSNGLSSDEIDELQDAIDLAYDADIMVVAASGNDSEDCSDFYPAAFDHVYTVSATNSRNLLADFSNYGDEVDILAPGAKIISTYLDDQYAYMSGTSMAAPIVTGIAAMLIAYDEDLSVDELAEYLDESANYLATYEDKSYSDVIGSGLIDAAGAYELVSGDDIYDQEEFAESLEATVSSTRVGSNF